MNNQVRWTQLSELSNRIQKKEADAALDSSDYDVQREVLKDWAYWLFEAIRPGGPPDSGGSLSPAIGDCEMSIEQAHRAPHLADEDVVVRSLSGWLSAVQTTTDTRSNATIGSSSLVGAPPTPDEIMSGAATAQVTGVAFPRPSKVVVVQRHGIPFVTGHPNWRPGTSLAVSDTTAVLRDRESFAALPRFEVAYSYLAYPHRLAASELMDRLDQHAAGAATPAQRAELLGQIAVELRAARSHTHSQIGNTLCDAEDARLSRLVGRE